MPGGGRLNALDRLDRTLDRGPQLGNLGLAGGITVDFAGARGACFVLFQDDRSLKWSFSKDPPNLSAGLPDDRTCLVHTEKS